MGDGIPELDTAEHTLMKGSDSSGGTFALEVFLGLVGVGCGSQVLAAEAVPRDTHLYREKRLDSTWLVDMVPGQEVGVEVARGIVQDIQSKQDNIQGSLLAGVQAPEAGHIQEVQVGEGGPSNVQVMLETVDTPHLWSSMVAVEFVVDL